MTAERIYVKPREGLSIRDPLTMERIPPEGMEVVLSDTRNARTVIRKQIADGDLVECEAPALPNALREVGTDQRTSFGADRTQKGE